MIYKGDPGQPGNLEDAEIALDAAASVQNARCLIDAKSLNNRYLGLAFQADPLSAQEYVSIAGRCFNLAKFPASHTPVCVGATILFDDMRSSRLRRKIARALLAIDAFVDSSLHASRERAREITPLSPSWTGSHLAGWRHVLNEFACETLTLGSASAWWPSPLPVRPSGNLRRLAEETDLAVTFLDRYGQRSGGAASGTTTRSRSTNCRKSDPRGDRDRGPAVLRSLRDRR
jgi:hypothetical protein